MIGNKYLHIDVLHMGHVDVHLSINRTSNIFMIYFLFIFSDL